MLGDLPNSPSSGAFQKVMQERTSALDNPLGSSADRLARPGGCFAPESGRLDESRARLSQWIGTRAHNREQRARYVRPPGILPDSLHLYMKRTNWKRLSTRLEQQRGARKSCGNNPNHVALAPLLLWLSSNSPRGETDEAERNLRIAKKLPRSLRGHAAKALVDALQIRFWLAHGENSAPPRGSRLRPLHRPIRRAE